MKRSKKYQELAKQVDKAKLYESAEALALAKKTATSKFDETIEVHIKTGCDGRHTTLWRGVRVRLYLGVAHVHKTKQEMCGRPGTSQQNFRNWQEVTLCGSCHWY